MNNILFPLLVFATMWCTPYDPVESLVVDFLDEAKKECLVASYTINNPAVIDKLIELHQNGVDVEVITDTTQAAGKHEVEAINRLRHYSIPVFIGRSAQDQLMHAKFIVIDNEASETGSYNFTVSANKQDNVVHINHDLYEAQKLREYWFKIKEDLR
jgi:phosphatidylserine/phosphatidylglycerophosphate/cardiolipin synthase-like enzyme